MKHNRKKEWIHLLLAVLFLVVAWAYKDFVAVALCVAFSVVVFLWCIAMWQAIAKDIPIKEVSLEETINEWWFKIKVRCEELVKKPAKKVEEPVEEYEVEENQNSEIESEEEEVSVTKPEEKE